MQTWLPTIVSGLALGALFFFLRSSRAENREAIKEIKLKMEKDEKETEKKMDTEYLKTSAHTLLCENQALKMREFFQTEFTQLKDDIFGAIRNLEKTIKNNGHN